MTTFARTPTKPAAASPWSESVRLVVRWSVLEPATRRRFTLEWSIRREDETLRADATIIDDAGRRGLVDFSGIPVRWTRDERLKLDHFDAPGRADTDLPALNVSVDLSTDSPALIFARSAVFAALGLPGGRYEPAGAAFVPNRDD